MFFPSLLYSNQNHIIYPYKTINSIYPMKSIKCFKKFRVNPSNSLFNKVSIPIKRVPVTQVPIDISEKGDNNDEIAQNKNNNLLIQQNINKIKLNIINNDVTKNNKNILNQKRKRTESNNIYFLVKKEQKKPIVNLSFKKNMFNVYHKSQYIYKTRKNKKASEKLIISRKNK